ncbi:MAG TPA: hypothetical protein H9846_00140 [Candidatus Gemmiger excrementipullorum]|uniref:Uncharacterized protein n=1 Tax=Candidatus Gemmiger excrementipullorum TaxID=2838610 RepID=A0A9D1XZ12_9FIRM|nr:hypothetical protein [Candidatus Gemmiger excrementipullorum]
MGDWRITNQHGYLHDIDLVWDAFPRPERESMHMFKKGKQKRFSPGEHSRLLGKSADKKESCLSPITMHFLSILILVVSIAIGLTIFFTLTAVFSIDGALAVNVVFGFTSLGFLADAIFFIVFHRKVDQSNKQGKAYVTIMLLVGVPAEIIMAIWGFHLTIR